MSEANCACTGWRHSDSIRLWLAQHGRGAYRALRLEIGVPPSATGMQKAVVTFRFGVAQVPAYPF
jgi:hypothetical protein